MLLDESGDRARRGSIPQRPRRLARKNFERWISAVESGRPGEKRMKFSAVLLAGGKSRRMGRDKATIQFRSAPLWQNQLDLLRKLEPAQLLVSAPTDPFWRPKDVEFVADAQPSRGPLSGIVAALSRINNDHLLVLAIDMPFMSKEYLRELGARVGPSAGVVPVIADRAEPLAAIYPREALAEFSSALAEGDLSLQPLVRRLIGLGKLRPVTVSSGEVEVFGNLNQPSDLNRS